MAVGKGVVELLYLLGVDLIEGKGEGEKGKGLASWLGLEWTIPQEREQLMAY